MSSSPPRSTTPPRLSPSPTPSSSSSTNPAKSPQVGTTLSERIARLNLNNTSSSLTTTSAASLNLGASAKDRAKVFDATDAAPLIPKGSFGLGASADKIVPGGLGKGFSGANTDRNRTKVGGGHAYVPGMGPRTVSGTVTGPVEGGTVVGAGNGTRSVSSSTVRKAPVNERKDSASSEASSNPTTSIPSLRTPEDSMINDSSSSIISKHSSILGSATVPPNSVITNASSLPTGLRTPMGSISSMNVETGSVMSDREREREEEVGTPVVEGNAETEGGEQGEEEKERFRAELTRKHLEAYENEEEDMVKRGGASTPKDGDQEADSYYDDILDDYPAGKTEPPTPLPQETSFISSKEQEVQEDLGMPKVKCSDCGKDVDLMLLASHVCGKLSPSQSPSSSRPDSQILSTSPVRTSSLAANAVVNQKLSSSSIRTVPSSPAPSNPLSSLPVGGGKMPERFAKSGSTSGTVGGGTDEDLKLDSLGVDVMKINGNTSGAGAGRVGGYGEEDDVLEDIDDLHLPDRDNSHHHHRMSLASSRSRRSSADASAYALDAYYDDENSDTPMDPAPDYGKDSKSNSNSNSNSNVRNRGPLKTSGGTQPPARGSYYDFDLSDEEDYQGGSATIVRSH